MQNSIVLIPLSDNWRQGVTEACQAFRRKRRSRLPTSCTKDRETSEKLEVLKPVNEPKIFAILIPRINFSADSQKRILAFMIQ